jgi:hypothetical protein
LIYALKKFKIQNNNVRVINFKNIIPTLLLK